MVPPRLPWPTQQGGGGDAPANAADPACRARPRAPPGASAPHFMLLTNGEVLDRLVAASEAASSLLTLRHRRGARVSSRQGASARKGLQAETRAQARQAKTPTLSADVAWKAWPAVACRWHLNGEWQHPHQEGCQCCHPPRGCPPWHAALRMHALRGGRSRSCAALHAGAGLNAAPRCVPRRHRHAVQGG